MKKIKNGERVNKIKGITHNLNEENTILKKEKYLYKYFK